MPQTLCLTLLFTSILRHILEGTFEVLLVTAPHVKTMPGGRTDVHDVARLTELLRHGL